MQEVRKLLNPETVIDETPAPEKKNDEWVNLCLVKIGDGQVVPVYMPMSVHVYVGDLVTFDPNGDGDVFTAEVFYVSDTEQVDGDVWTMAAMASQRVPVKIIKTWHMKTVKWEGKT